MGCHKQIAADTVKTRNLQDEHKTKNQIENEIFWSQACSAKLQ
jgi:hypothetical protein